MPGTLTKFSFQEKSVSIRKKKKKKYIYMNIARHFSVVIHVLIFPSFCCALRST